MRLSVGIPGRIHLPPLSDPDPSSGSLLQDPPRLEQKLISFLIALIRLFAYLSGLHHFSVSVCLCVCLCVCVWVCGCVRIDASLALWPSAWLLPLPLDFPPSLFMILDNHVDVYKHKFICLY